jgi:hypothetical protein
MRIPQCELAALLQGDRSQVRTATFPSSENRAAWLQRPTGPDIRQGLAAKIRIYEVFGGSHLASFRFAFFLSAAGSALT